MELCLANISYTDKGKKYKLFGPDDSDALKILNKYLKHLFCFCR